MRKIRREWIFVGYCIAAIFLAYATPSSALGQGFPNGADYAQLQQRVRQLEEEMLKWRPAAASNAVQEPFSAPSFGAPPLESEWPAEDADRLASLREGSPPPKNADGVGVVKADHLTVNLGGFFQGDSGWFNQDANNIATVGDIQDGADFRRARLNAHGDVWDNVSYMVEFDFAFPGRPSFMDVYLDVLRIPLLGTLRFGQWRQPFGMDGQTSVKDLTFLERSLPFAFLPFRQIGVGLINHTRDESATWAVSMFRFPTDTFGGNVGDDGGYGTAARATFLPLSSEDGRWLLHLGMGYVFADPSNDQVRYASPPEFFVAQIGSLIPPVVPPAVPLFVDTGPIPTRNFHLFGAEGGLLMGPLHLQSEAIYAVVNQLGGPTASLSGAYGQLGYVLTGETRQFNRTGGVFGRIIPEFPLGLETGFGAWELTARYSYLDLNDANVAGGRLNDVTIGLNWYLNPRAKFQFNYIHAFLDAPAFGDSDADIYGWRGQIDF